MTDPKAHRPTHILTAIHEIPPKGFDKLLIHIDRPDKHVVDLAAQAMGLSQQNWMRMVLVNASKKVCDELGVKLPV